LFVELAGADSNITQDSCLRGGATIRTLVRDGNGMQTKFKSPNALNSDGSHDIGAPTVEALLTATAGWDFVVINDYTQGPARSKNCRSSIKALLEGGLAQMIQKAGATPVLVQTWAYREHVKDSEDLGDNLEFTNRLLMGIEEYAKAVAPIFDDAHQPRVAKVGNAFHEVYMERRDIWTNLFHSDGYHPAPAGSYLLACVVYCTIFGAAPPKESSLPRNPSNLWRYARRMQPPQEPLVHMPTHSELQYLRSVATRVCGLGLE